MALPALGMESASLSFELKAEAKGSIGKGGISRMAPSCPEAKLQSLPPILRITDLTFGLVKGIEPFLARHFVPLYPT